MQTSEMAVKLIDSNGDPIDLQNIIGLDEGRIGIFGPCVVYFHPENSKGFQVVRAFISQEVFEALIKINNKLGELK